jgi:hypothetical protein
VTSWVRGWLSYPSIYSCRPAPYHSRLRIERKPRKNTAHSAQCHNFGLRTYQAHKPHRKYHRASDMKRNIAGVCTDHG